MPADARQSIRANLNIPHNATVFLNANRNSQRKRLDVMVQGFVKLLARNPEKPYYLVIVTNSNPQSGAYYDIPRIFSREIQKFSNLTPLIASRLVLIDSAPPNVIGDDGINQIYNIADIGVNTSDGEGFGLCQLEHMFTGAPQVVTDIGSYRSFINNDVGVFIPPGPDVYFAGAMPLGGWAPSFNPDDVTAAMEEAVSRLPEMKKNLESYKFKSWSDVCDTWLEDVLSA
jgi:glycosyltransferase involved in cell wall biosynthesis